MSDPLAQVHGFVAAVRRAGVAAGPDRVQALLQALDVSGLSGLYWAGRLTLCGSPEDLARYDALWQAGTGPAGRDQAAGPPVPPARGRAALPLAGGDTAAGDTGGGPELAVAARASAAEVLRHRDLAQLTTAERAEVRRMLALLAPVAPRRVTRRRRRAPAGRVAPRRTLRAILRGWGEPSRLARDRPGHRPRRLVLLLDVSGSMAPYADALLRFAHAAVRARPAATEVFTIGTRLTRVTGALQAPDPTRAACRAG